MSVWSNLKNWFGGSATSQQPGEQYNHPVFGDSVESARQVTEDSALSLSAVWACVQLLSETVSTLPLNVYEKSGENRTIASNDLQTILHDRPNSVMTSAEWRQAMMLNLVLHGNAYSMIERAGPRVASLWPMAATSVTPKILDDGSLVYEHGTSSGFQIIAPGNVLHIKRFGNGVVGLSPLAYARSTLGVSLSTDTYTRKFFTNGGKPSGILTIDKVLTEEQRGLIRKNFKGISEGAENAHQMMILEAGMKYQQVQISPEDAQMIETMRFQLQDIARFFGVPSFLLNDNAQTTWGSGIEQMMLGFYKLTIRPYLTTWEQALTHALLTPSERRRFTIEHNFEGLLRGDSAGRAEYYSKMVQNGLMTRNEARKKENLPLVEGGDELTAQINLAPISKLGDFTTR